MEPVDKPKFKRWWHDGVRFECQGSGKCCASRGSYGFVYLTMEDRMNLARHFKMSIRDFTKKYCKRTQGYYHLIDEPDNPNCIYLEGKSCSVYEARPMQCRTWPFWPDNMSVKRWNSEVAKFCPGVGKGKLWSEEQIKEQMDKQKKADKDY